MNGCIPEDSRERPCLGGARGVFMLRGLGHPDGLLDDDAGVGGNADAQPETAALCSLTGNTPERRVSGPDEMGSTLQCLQRKETLGTDRTQLRKS